MNVIVVMMTFAAFLLAQRVHDRIVGSGNSMDDPFFDKGLQRSVNGYPIETCSAHFFYVCMRKRMPASLKQLKYLHPVFSDAKLALS